jgi:nitroreductase
VVVTDRAILAKVPEIHPHAAMSREAAAAILVCGDVTLERYADNWPLDCSAATQNLLLALHALGLGAVWAGVFPGDAICEAFQELFGLPDHVVPLAYVPIGYPASASPTVDRYREDRVHRNRWSAD